MTLREARMDAVHGYWDESNAEGRTLGLLR
jgi:hypothetical protein